MWCKEKLANRKEEAMSFDLGEWVMNDARSSIVAQFPDSFQIESQLYALYDGEIPNHWDDDSDETKASANCSLVAAMYGEDIQDKNDIWEYNNETVANVFAEDSQTMNNSEEGSCNSVAELDAEDSETVKDNGECNSLSVADVFANETVETGSESAVDVQNVGDDEGEDSISLESHSREDVPLV